MKWFKHFSDSLDDPFIQELMDEFGHQGYVAYFGILEIVAKENGKILTGKLTISPAYLKRKLRISPKKLREIFEFCSGEVEEKLEKSSGEVREKFRKTSTKPKLFFRFTKEKWIFNIPKLLVLRDNFTKDLQVTCKKLPNHKEAEEEEDKDKEKDKKETLKKRQIFRDEDFQKLLDSREKLNELAEKCKWDFEGIKWAVQRIKDYCSNRQKWKTRDIPATIRQWELKAQFYQNRRKTDDPYFRDLGDGDILESNQCGKTIKELMGANEIIDV